MTRQELIDHSEHRIRRILLAHLPLATPVYLFGSRARNNHRWNSDYDLWVDADLEKKTIREIEEELEESFVPFRVDIVTTRQLNNRFGEMVRVEARRWI
jgi:predicted nucleotidyltransferase